MIRYTLACDAGHSFESWFPSGDAYDEQSTRGLVSCPLCDSRKVAKTMMAPSVARTDKGRSGNAVTPLREKAPIEGQGPAPVETPFPMIAEPERRLRALLRAVREQVTRTAADVGARFPEEARAMHYGDAPTRAIYGEASFEEAKALVEEGIEVAPLPPAPDDRH